MKDNNRTPDIMTACEVSEHLRIPLSTIHALASHGKLPAVKIGKQWRFQKADVEAYLLGKRFSIPPSSQDARVHLRIKSEIPAQLTGLLSQTKDYPLQGEIRNLSEGGIYFIPQISSPHFESGDPVEICFQVPEDPSVPLKLRGRIVRALDSRNGFGVKFRPLIPQHEEVLRAYVG